MDHSQQIAGSHTIDQIRTRRRCLWIVFLTYLPAVWLSLRLTGSNQITLAVAIIWLVLAAVAGVMVSASRCPGCGKLFHMQGVATSWGARCVHCDLSLKPLKPTERT